MTKIIGRLKDIGIAKESSRGTGVAPTFWVPKSDFTVDDKVVKARNNSAYGSIVGQGNQVLIARNWAEGDMEFDLLDKSFGLFLYALLGGLVTTGPTDSLYTHTFSLANTNQHQSLSITAKESTISTRMYRLAMINSLEIEVDTESIVKVKVNFLAKSGMDTTATVSYAAENKFVGRHLSFKLATLTSGLGAASRIPVKSLKLKFEKNAMLDHSLGTVQPQDILNQAFNITGTVQLDYSDRTYRDLMFAGTYNAVRIDLTNTNVTIGASSNPSFTLDLSRVDFDQWESKFPLDEIASQTFNFMALYDITNGNVINSCTLKNAQASY